MRVALALMLLASAGSVLAQPGQAPSQAEIDRIERVMDQLAAEAVGPTPVRIEHVAPGVFILFGRGGNVGLSHGEDGNVLIDDQYAPMSAPIAAAVASIDPDPVRFVINTHWHGDHVGGNEYFARAGSVIVAHDNVRRRMTMEQIVRGEVVPPSSAGALPIVTFSENLSFHLNGDEIRVHHVEHAHTDGDALVYWTGANVLHMGDIYFEGMLPFIDLDSGGSIDGVLAAVDRGLAIANERTVIVPGHGPIATRAGLAAYRERLAGMRARVIEAIAAGQSLDQIKALRLADAHGRDTDFISPDFFVETLYRSLSAGSR